MSYPSSSEPPNSIRVSSEPSPASFSPVPVNSIKYGTFPNLGTISIVPLSFLNSEPLYVIAFSVKNTSLELPYVSTSSHQSVFSSDESLRIVLL